MDVKTGAAILTVPFVLWHLNSDDEDGPDEIDAPMSPDPELCDISMSAVDAEEVEESGGAGKVHLEFLKEENAKEPDKKKVEDPEKEEKSREPDKKEAEFSEREKSKEDFTFDWATAPFKKDDEVFLVHLYADGNLNDKEGRIIDDADAKGKFTVQLNETGEMVKVLPKNLAHIECRDSTSVNVFRESILLGAIGTPEEQEELRKAGLL